MSKSQTCENYFLNVQDILCVLDYYHLIMNKTININTYELNIDKNTML